MQSDGGDEEPRQQSNCKFLKQAANRTDVAGDMGRDIRDRDHQRQCEDPSLVRKDALRNPDCETDGDEAKPRQHDRDHADEIQWREHTFEWLEQPTVERGVLRDEGGVGNVAGDRPKDVIDLVEVVVDGRHVVECPNRTQSVEQAYGDHNNAEDDAERRGETARSTMVWMGRNSADGCLGFSSRRARRTLAASVAGGRLVRTTS